MTPPPGYFDARHLTPMPKGGKPRCPVTGCTAVLATASSQWGEMPFCPLHGIRIHGGSSTFVYYNGSDKESKRKAALRNVWFEGEYFSAHILDKSEKTETYRICHENSEDALTWNVFARLASAGVLPRLMSQLTKCDVANNPELYLWGLKVDLKDSSRPTLFPVLKTARQKFEKDVRKYRTEPDIMLYVPGQLLLLIEAKFTSGNTLATNDGNNDQGGEKPKSLTGLLERYTCPDGVLADGSPPDPFYSQLYRNMVFAMHMARELGVQWAVASLVADGQFKKRCLEAEFKDPTSFADALLSPASRKWFATYTWERLYTDYVAKDPPLTHLAEYLSNKSAFCAKALAI